MSERKSRARPDAKSASAAEDTQSLLEAMENQSVDALDKLSRNLGEVLVRSQKMGVELAERAAHDNARPIRPDPYGLTPYAADVATRLAADPERMVEAQMKLWSGYAEIWTDAMKAWLGNGERQPAPKDKRFADPDWDALPMFDIMRRTYLHTSRWMSDLVESAPGVDDMTRRKALFFAKQLSDAFSPSNFLLTNPVALRETLASGGENLVKGLRNLEHDLEKGKGRIALSQTDDRPFKVGENIAVTPGKVVHRGEIFELLQYNPVTETVFETPIVFFPPWINKFYILDLRQDNSMIKWLTEQGHTVFVVSWLNPGPEHATKSFEDYMRLGIFEAVEAVTKATGSKKVNAVGYCIGGTLLASTMARIAHEKKPATPRGSVINTATFFASQQDFVEAGDLKVFTDDAAMQYIRDEITAAGGVLDSAVMAETFNFLRANDLVWSFVVNNYLLGKDPKPFDLLFWNSDQTRMPRDLHLFYLETFYRRNALTKHELVVDGRTLDLGMVKTPIYMQSSREDHIAPYRSIYRGARQFGGPVRMILAGSGHIAGVINHPDAKKYQHWLPAEGDNGPLPDTVEQWQAGLVEHPGSWWPDWAKWLAGQSGKQVPARTPGDGGLPVLGDAPGTYVLEK